MDTSTRSNSRCGGNIALIKTVGFLLHQSTQYIYKAYSMDRFVEMNAPERKKVDSVMLIHME